MSIYPAPVFSGLPSKPASQTVISDRPGYQSGVGDTQNTIINLTSTATRPFESNLINQIYYYDDVSEAANGGHDTIQLTTGMIQSTNTLTGSISYHWSYNMPINVENIIVIPSAITDNNQAIFTVNGNDSNNYFIQGQGSLGLAFNGGDGNDAVDWRIGIVNFDGGPGIDFASTTSLRNQHIVTGTTNGIIVTSIGDGSRLTSSNVEIIQYGDYAIAVENIFPFSNLLLSNISQLKAISAGYQTLLGGIPSIVGYDFLIKANRDTNFGSGSGSIFNEENIFINVVNALIQGNSTAASKFASLATGASLADKVFALYKSVIPTAKQTLEGLAFLTRPEGLAFYESVARERGITSENGAAIVALASLLKIAVDGRLGIGNPVNDLIAAIGNGSAQFQSGLSGTFTPIESADGPVFDVDDAPDFMPGFAGPPPVILVGNTPPDTIDLGVG